jgi:membrane protease YdiL (CAAX protease family)
MEIYDTQAEIASRKNWPLSLVSITLLAFGILVMLQGIAMALVPFLFHLTVDDLIGLASGNFDVPNGRMALLFVQGLGSGLGFWVVTWFVLRFLEKADLRWERQWARVNGKNLAIVFVITLGGMLFNGLLMHWNAQLQLPGFLSEVEVWMKEMEVQLMELTNFLTDFQSIPELLMGILVIGVFAGIGEELFFRGLIQPKMQFYFRSPHLGIWVTAFVFSAIHVQFFGFLPRMFLGAVFGYLYHYTGSLVYPIVGHTLNNALTLLLVYFANQGLIEIDIQSTDAFSYPAALVGFLVLILGFLYFKKVNRTTDEKLDEGV